MENIKQILLDCTNDMPPEEKEVMVNAVEIVTGPVDPNFDPMLSEVIQIEGVDGYFGACENEFFN